MNSCLFKIQGPCSNHLSAMGRVHCQSRGERVPFKTTFIRLNGTYFLSLSFFSSFSASFPPSSLFFLYYVVIPSFFLLSFFFLPSFFIISSLFLLSFFLLSYFFLHSFLILSYFFLNSFFLRASFFLTSFFILS